MLTWLKKFNLHWHKWSEKEELKIYRLYGRALQPVTTIKIFTIYCNKCPKQKFIYRKH